MQLTADHNTELAELDQVERAIAASSSWLSSLLARRDALVHTLDALTRPTIAPPVAQGRTVWLGLQYRGQIVDRSAYIHIHAFILRRLWEDFPERRAAMAEAIGRCGNSRPYVAQSCEALFPGQSQPFTFKHSDTLADGWFFDTNLNRERMQRILPVAVRAAGLAWGTDVRAFWRRTVIPA